jgi:hypothetical protein
MEPHGTPIAIVDVIGVGAGVVDRLREEGYEVIAFNSAAKTDMMDAHGEFGFPNVRSAAWWNMRELLDPANPGNPIALPDDDQLISDLVAPRWRVLSGAKIQVEPKEDTKKRLRRSPDTADSVIMSFFYFGIDSGSAFVTEYGGTSAYTQPWVDQVFTQEREFDVNDYVFSGFER